MNVPPIAAELHDQAIANAADTYLSDLLMRAFEAIMEAAPKFSETEVVTCGHCNLPMIPNISTHDEDGYAWICTTGTCPDFTGTEIEAEDLIACGCPAWIAEGIQSTIDSLEQPQTARTWLVLSGTEYEITATSRQEAERKWADYCDDKPCHCATEGCTCVVEGEAATAWETR